MDWIDRLPWWLMWFGALAGFIVPIVTYVWLHEDPGKPERRRWRNIVISVSLVTALFGVVSAVKGGKLQQAVFLLQQLSRSQEITTLDLKRRLDSANREQYKEQAEMVATRAEVNAAKKRLVELRAATLALSRQSSLELRNERSIRRALEMRIANARKEVDAARRKISAVSSESRRALRSSEAATARALEISNTVEREERDTRRRLDEARSVANQAAAKAGIYHISVAAQDKISAVLQSGHHGTANVICVPGYEAACNDLGATFRRAGWRVGVIRAASLFTGGGLDAAVDTNRDAGAIVWYQAPHEVLARSIATILQSEGLVVDVRSTPAGPAETDIAITLRFVK